LPRKSAMRSGSDTLIQSAPSGKSGALTSPDQVYSTSPPSPSPSPPSWAHTPAAPSASALTRTIIPMPPTNNQPVRLMCVSSNTICDAAISRMVFCLIIYEKPGWTAPCLLDAGGDDPVTRGFRKRRACLRQSGATKNRARGPAPGCAWSRRGRLGDQREDRAAHRPRVRRIDQEGRIADHFRHHEASQPTTGVPQAIASSGPRPNPS